MAVRLNKVAREFNVGLSTIVEFCMLKGYKYPLIQMQNFPMKIMPWWPKNFHRTAR